MEDTWGPPGSGVPLLLPGHRWPLIDACSDLRGPDHVIRWVTERDSPFLWERRNPSGQVRVESIVRRTEGDVFEGRVVMAWSRPTSVGGSLCQLCLDPTRLELVDLSRAKNSRSRLREYLYTGSQLSEAAEDTEANDHPQLVRMRYPILGPTSREVFFYLLEDLIEFASGWRREATDACAVHRSISRPTFGPFPPWRAGRVNRDSLESYVEE